MLDFIVLKCSFVKTVKCYLEHFLAIVMFVSVKLCFSNRFGIFLATFKMFVCPIKSECVITKCDLPIEHECN